MKNPLPEIIIAEEHDQVYRYWLDQGLQDIAIAHIDFHCDMRGLMINRQRSTAYMASRQEKGFVDNGNFLSHAVMNGIVSAIRWIHHSHGGRRYDFGGTVKYESDIFALVSDVRRYLRADRKVSLAFEEMYLTNWGGPRPGEYLDIDWDAIASNEYELPLVRRLMEYFLSMEFPVIPDTTFLVFSPDYCHTDRTLFEMFSARLAEKFNARILTLPEPVLQGVQPVPERSVRSVTGAVHRILPRTLLALKYQALARLRAYETRHDVDPHCNHCSVLLSDAPNHLTDGRSRHGQTATTAAHQRCNITEETPCVYH